MTISISTPTSNTGSIQNNSADVLTIGSDNSVSVVNNLSSTSLSVNTDTLYVLENKVGIGTSTPSQELHVYGNNADGARIRLESTDYYTSLDMVCADGSINVINFGDASDVNVGRIDYDHSLNEMTFKTNDSERMRIDSSGNLLFNSGYGSVATAYGCRAWVNFNGTGTVAIRASGNVSSITDNGPGNYDVNMTIAMPDVNYCVLVTGAENVPMSSARDTPTQGAAETPSIANVNAWRSSQYDLAYMSVAIFR